MNKCRNCGSNLIVIKEVSGFPIILGCTKCDYKRHLGLIK